MSRTRVILIPAMAREPAPFLLVGADGGVLQRGVLPLDPAEAPAPMRTVAVVPGAEVSVRWLDLPMGGDAQVRAAALWMLRDDLAAPADRLALTLGAVAPGEPRLTVVVNRALLEAWTDYLDALGVKADVMLPDVLVLPVPLEGEAVAVGFGPNVALRAAGLAVSVQPDLVELMLNGRRLAPVENAEAVERMLAEAALRPAINLLSGRSRQTDLGRRGWKAAAALAAAVILSPLILTLAGAGRDEVAADRAEARAAEMVRRAMPDVAASADPSAEIARRMRLAPAAGGVGAVAAALFTAVESVEGAELDSFTADPEGGVRATVSYPAYEDLDTMKGAMTRAGLTLEDASTVDDGGRVVSDVRIGAST